MSIRLGKGNHCTDPELRSTDSLRPRKAAAPCIRAMASNGLAPPISMHQHQQPLFMSEQQNHRQQQHASIPDSNLVLPAASPPGSVHKACDEEPNLVYGDVQLGRGLDHSKVLKHLNQMSSVTTASSINNCTIASPTLHSTVGVSSQDIVSSQAVVMGPKAGCGTDRHRGNASFRKSGQSLEALVCATGGEPKGLQSIEEDQINDLNVLSNSVRGGAGPFDGRSKVLECPGCDLTFTRHSALRQVGTR